MRVASTHIIAPFLLLLAWCVEPLSLAQTPTTHRQLEVVSIAFEGNTSFPKSTLLLQMATRETPNFLTKFLHNSISERLGRKNEYVSPPVLATDLERLKKFYINHGFSDVKLDTSLHTSADDGTIDILIRVNEGYRARVVDAVYLGIPDAPEAIGEDIRADYKISPGEYYDSEALEEEVRRVLRIFNNQGFPNASFVRDSSVARRLLSTGDYTVRLVFDAGRRYLFGPITVAQEVDSLRENTRRDDIEDHLIIRQLDYAEGDFFSLERKIASERSLNSLGIFDLKQIAIAVPPKSDSSIYVPSLISIRPRDRHEVAPELLVSDENGAFNLGTGIGYTSRNFLGGARTFTTRLRFRTQTLNAFPDYFNLGNDAVSKVDLTFEMSQPYVLSNKIRGTWAFSFIVDKQRPYLQNIIRNKFGFTGRFAEYTTGILEWTLDAVDLRRNENFTGDLNDPVVQSQLALLQERQFNSVISFTIQKDITDDPFSPTEGFVQAATFDEAGLFPLALRRAIPNLPFTQFWRGILVGRWFRDFSGHRFSILALKLKGGIEEKYGESRSDPLRSIPQTHRFFAGGGASIRGWNSRDLIANGNPQLGGNVSFEGSIEVRTNIFQGTKDEILDKIWLVQFLDFGNVWGEMKDLQLKSVALAFGLGVRYDTIFGPFRFDWGIRIYNPREEPGHQWITQRRLIGETFSDGVFHFGIGHAF
jgi:outer membrane protein insertion porin family